MGASNFARPENASKYFTVLMNREEKFVECKDCESKFFEYESEYETAESQKHCGSCGSENIEFDEESRSCEEWEIDDLKNFIKEKMEEKFKGVQDYDYKDYDRNYPSSGISRFFVQETFCGEEIEIEFGIILTWAYYEGATLDFLITKYLNGDEVYGEFTKDDLYNTDLNEGMKELQWRNFDKKINSIVEKYSKEINELLEEVSTPLSKLGTFSNGESVYVGA